MKRPTLSNLRIEITDAPGIFDPRILKKHTWERQLETEEFNRDRLKRRLERAKSPFKRERFIHRINSANARILALTLAHR